MGNPLRWFECRTAFANRGIFTLGNVLLFKKAEIAVERSFGVLRQPQDDGDCAWGFDVGLLSPDDSDDVAKAP